MKPAMRVLAAVLPLAGASYASAAIVCVAPPSVTTCPNHTIQAGVDAAAPGDVVKVAPGVYYENVVVPAGKDNLQILGTSKLTTILDPDLPNVGIGIFVNGANGVKIANIGIRNGANYAILMNGNGAIISGVRLVATRGAGAVRVTGDDAQVLLNEVRASAMDGIWVVGNGGLIKSNTVAQIAGFGIVAMGDHLQVVGNKITSAGMVAYGLYVSNSATGQNVVASNVLENIGYGGSAAGLLVSDIEPTIRANKLVWAGAASFNCTVNCSGGTVSLNTVTGSPGWGLVVGSSAPVLVQGNRIAYTAQDGLSVWGPAGLAQGSGIQVTQNSATDTGLGYAGFIVMGSGHALTANVARRCGGAGFQSNGDSLVFASNAAMGASTSGFLLDGYNGGGPAHFGVTLNDNKTLGSIGQGFALYDRTNGGFNPVGTTGTGNTGLTNRQDLCNEGVPVSIGAFATTSTTCDIRN